MNPGMKDVLGLRPARRAGTANGYGGYREVCHGMEAATRAHAQECGRHGYLRIYQLLTYFLIWQTSKSAISAISATSRCVLCAGAGRQPDTYQPPRRLTHD
jgi:hypothetical protein